MTSFTAVQALAEWQTTGNKEWHKWYKFPTFGVSLTYINIENHRIAHHGIATMAHITFKWIERTNYQLKFGLGVGVGYFSNLYNQQTNSSNEYISTHFNGAIQFSFDNLIKISPTSYILITPTINHFSNGASLLPNFGLNMLSFAFGLKQQITESKSNNKPQKSDIFTIKKNFIHVGVSGGVTGLAVPNYNQSFNYIIDASYGRRITKKSKLLIGVNIIHDNADNNKTVHDKILITRPYFIIDRIGLWAGHELFIHRLGFVAGIGVYLKKPAEQDILYSRIGLRYHLHKNMFCAVYLRTKLGFTADTIEWTLGFTI